MTTKTRKAVNGEIRNKERTKEKLVASIGKILAEETYSNLQISRIPTASGFNPKLIYLYFGDLEKLISSYLQQKSTKETLPEKISTQIHQNATQTHAEDIAYLFEEEYKTLIEDRELSGLLHWALTSKNKELTPFTKKQKSIWEKALSNLSDSKDNKINREGAQEELLLILAGITYLAIRSKVSLSSPFMGLDMSDDNTQERIKKTIDRLICGNF
ncbi:TetR/AcrR family transcriptional regulator [Sphingobacterium sp. LRF_L2]|uniref:TetR/AcrR family transcriptional regulator n=1 Tax=Sphingobacterium sp. LRF_L2 TaxID=3369421 RepID=UPI003F5F2425